MLYRVLYQKEYRAGKTPYIKLVLTKVYYLVMIPSPFFADRFSPRYWLELRTFRVIGGEQTRLCFSANKLAVQVEVPSITYLVSSGRLSS